MLLFAEIRLTTRIVPFDTKSVMASTASVDQNDSSTTSLLLTPVIDATYVRIKSLKTKSKT